MCLSCYLFIYEASDNVLVKDSPDDCVAVDVCVVEERVKIRQQRVPQHHCFTHQLLSLRVETSRVLQSRQAIQTDCNETRGAPIMLSPIIGAK